jgi:hypothetical protein
MLLRCARRGPALLLAAVVLAGLSPASPVRAESGLLLEYPPVVGTVPAATYDLARHQVGKAHLVLERLDNGHLRMLSDSGFTAGVRTVVTAELAPVDGSGKLRPTLQESRSFDPDGSPRGVLSIDHRSGKASCRGPDGALVGELALPPDDRVANVPLNLMFLPLVRGEAEELRFQIFLCGGGPRLLDFVANIAPGSQSGDDSGHLIEVRYGPDFGLATLVARSFVPKLSFWFDAEAPHDWMAHRLPLYGEGPEVFVVRDGVPTRWLPVE